MADQVITVQKLIDADKDATSLDTFINGADSATVTTRKLRTYPSLAKAVKQVMETGGFEPFATELQLLASVPTIAKKAAKAIDTKKVWLWDGSKWNDTGLSEFDLSKSFAINTFTKIDDYKPTQDFIYKKRLVSKVIPTGLTYGSHRTGTIFSLKETYEHDLVLSNISFQIDPTTSAQSMQFALYAMIDNVIIQYLGSYEIPSISAGLTEINVDILLPKNTNLAVGIPTDVSIMHSATGGKGFLYKRAINALNLPVNTAIQSMEQFNNGTAGIGYTGYTYSDSDKLAHASDVAPLVKTTTLTISEHLLPNYSTGNKGDIIIPRKLYKYGGIISKLWLNRFSITQGVTSTDIHLYAVNSDFLVVKGLAAINVDLSSTGIFEINGLNLELPENCYLAIAIPANTFSMGYSTSQASQVGGFHYFKNVSNVVVGVGVPLQSLTTSNMESLSRPCGMGMIVTFKEQYDFSKFLTNESNPFFGKKVVAIGDSMVQGHTLTDTQTWLSKLASRNGMNFVNYGQNGTYLTSKVYNGKLGVVTRYTDMVDDADFVLVYAGTNDAVGNVSLGTIESTDVTEFYGALNTLCDGLITKYPNKKIGFITPYYKNSNFLTYINAIVECCAKYSIPVFNNGKDGGICWSNAAQLAALTLGDGYHLNEAGMEYVSHKYESFMKSL